MHLSAHAILGKSKDQLLYVIMYVMLFQVTNAVLIKETLFKFSCQ